MGEPVKPYSKQGHENIFINRKRNGGQGKERGQRRERGRKEGEREIKKGKGEGEGGGKGGRIGGERDRKEEGTEEERGKGKRTSFADRTREGIITRASMRVAVTVVGAIIKTDIRIVVELIEKKIKGAATITINTYFINISSNIRNA